MKVFALAAGYATRLYPLTHDVPKPLLEVAGVPVLERSLSRVLALGCVSEVVVVANHRFASHFRDWSRKLRLPAPIRVLDDGSTQDENRLGAIGDLDFALDAVPVGDEDFLVLAGDNLIDFDLGPAWHAFREARRPLLLLHDVVPEREPSPYNEVTLDAGGRVVGFREKPPQQTNPLSAIALYFFTPDVAPLVKRHLARGGHRDAPGYFIEWLVTQRPVGGIRFEGQWFDIGGLSSLAAARARFGDAPDGAPPGRARNG